VCITLRQFLKISGYKLNTRVIPYIELLEKIKVKNDVDEAQIKESQNISETVKIKTLSDKMICQINFKILQIENKKIQEENYDSLTIVTKLFSFLFVPFNLDSILYESLDDYQFYQAPEVEDQSFGNYVELKNKCKEKTDLTHKFEEKMNENRKLIEFYSKKIRKNRK
jgi:hypothetical protein